MIGFFKKFLINKKEKQMAKKFDILVYDTDATGG